MIIKKIVIISILIFYIVTTELFSGITDKDLHYVMPSATSFSAKSGRYPHWDAFIGKRVIGICFITTDIDSSIKGYMGPIKILVGIYKNRTIAGIKIISHIEDIPEADRIREDWFQLQFSGKKIDAPFAVGKEINGITGATVTVNAVAKSVKRTSKIMADIFFPYSKRVEKRAKVKSAIRKIPTHQKTVTKKLMGLPKVNKNLYYYYAVIMVFFFLIFLGIDIKLKKRKVLLIFLIIFELFFLLVLFYIITFHYSKTENIIKKSKVAVKSRILESNVEKETNIEKIILHPKWGIQRFNKEQFKKRINNGELSGKEAYNYKVVSD